MKRIICSFLMMGALTGASRAAATLTVDVANPVGKVSPVLYGLMTEEINYSYDGGLYAELVRNRAFLDDPKQPVNWELQAPAGANGAMALDFKAPLNDAIPVSLRVDATSASPAAPLSVANSGYWGIPIKQGTRYRSSFYAKAANFSGPVRVSLVSDDGKTIYAQADVPRLTADWKEYVLVLRTAYDAAPTTKARLVLSVEHSGTVWFGFVSLFPPTWGNQPNGFRPDLLQMLVDLNPKFLRFPGGNYLEGNTIETRFKWKETLGPVEKRPGHPSPWGYRSTDGMGIAEFLRWCEDMGSEPVLAVYAGYSLGGMHVNPGADLEPFVQDALDEIEYVTGPVNSKWGARRAADGHPKPYPLHYVEIGNEDWFDKSGSYDSRFAQFSVAIKAKYPQLKCISTIGHDQSADKRVHSVTPDVLDEHFYQNADSFIRDGAHYDHFDRTGPEIFVGEWAAHETSFPPWDRRSAKEAPTPNMKAALGDAVWMAGMERNSDIVKMNCYAPLLVNVNGRQWRPDLIGYDASRSYGSPSYYAFKMFSRNVGEQLLKVNVDGDSKLQISATRDSHSGIIYLKIVNPTDAAEPANIDLKGVKSVSAKANVETLSGEVSATNTMDDPAKVVPVTSKLDGVKPTFPYTLPAHSLVVLKLKAR